MILFKASNKVTFLNLFFFLYFIFYNNILFSQNLPLCEDLFESKNSTEKITNYNKCFGEYTFQDNQNYFQALKYIGEWLDNLPHGDGEMVYSDGSVFKGSWDKGLREGYGTMLFKKGFIMEHTNSSYIAYEYNGNWLNDEMNGKGEMIFDDGEYIGNFLKNKMHGYGVMHYKNNEKYLGNWFANAYHNFGTKIYKNKSKYIGNWVNGKRTGNGKFYYANGNIYEGQWYSDIRRGYGKLIYPNGKVVKGNFAPGYFGNGIYVLNDIFQLFDCIYFWYNKIISS